MTDITEIMPVRKIAYCNKCGCIGFNVVSCFSCHGKELTLYEQVKSNYKIRKLRRDRLIGQGELADMAGIKQANLSRIENGRVLARRVTLEKIAKALGVSVEELANE